MALRESGAIASGDRAYRNGLEYLLRTQFEDGSWIVESYKAPWVFSREIEKAEALYKQLISAQNKN